MVMADTTPARKTRMVNYLGVLQQALRDVAAWVEHGIAPPGEHGVRARRRPGRRARRRPRDRSGVQAVVDLTANGSAAPRSPSARRSSSAASIECRTGAGTIVGAEWDFEGTGEYPLTSTTTSTVRPTRLALTATHTFAEPGTYFPALRVTSQRSGDTDTPHARIQNLGRVRVVVEEH